MSERKIILSEKDIPKKWYNIAPDLPRPLDPPLNPQTRQPVGPDDLSAIFPMGLIEQEVSRKRWIPIPDEILDILSMWRPTPMYRAYGLEKALKTPAKIYYKYEGGSPPGSHKPNTSVAQAYYNKKEGIKRIATETGAGQWGSALAFACNHFGMECLVYMVRVSFEQKPYRRLMMQTWGARCVPSPSNETNAGRSFLEKDPDSSGSLGMAISEAVEVAATNKDTNYSLGSVLNHVMLHQTVIGQECIKQMKKVGCLPDIIIGCVGGGSNFAGLTFPFVPMKLEGKKDIRFVAVEPQSCPTLTQGRYEYDLGDTGGMTPLLKMYTLGHDFVPAPIHAGGLRYHGDSPLVSLLVNAGVVEAVAYNQNDIFEAAMIFAQSEGIIPAPESAHAIRAAVDEANKCIQTGEEKVILFGLSGHGYFDLTAYDQYLTGRLT